MILGMISLDRLTGLTCTKITQSVHIQAILNDTMVASSLTPMFFHSQKTGNEAKYLVSGDTVQLQSLGLQVTRAAQE